MSGKLEYERGVKDAVRIILERSQRSGASQLDYTAREIVARLLPGHGGALANFR